MQCLKLALVVGISLIHASNVTPVQKVVQMLESMKDKGTKEMNEEQVQYAKFEEFCKGTLAEKDRSITAAADQIETLDAEIESATSEAARLAEEISEHAADIEAASKEKQNATEIREKTRSDFVETLKDYTESIDAVGRALKVLKAEKKSSSFLELKAVRELKTLPSEAKENLDQLTGSSLLEAAPEAKTYEFQSGGVISMLEGLQDKFVDERVSLEKEEAAKRHTYEMLVQSLEAQLAQSKKDQDSKVQFKAKKLQAKAAAEGDLEETKTEKTSDEKYAKDLKATCSKKAAAFDERQKLRKEELEALSKAQDIISSGAVAGSAEKHLPSLLAAPATALAFLRSWAARPAELDEVTRFLQQRASALSSRVLSATAERAGADPVAKVKTMIEQLIVKMQDQANEEATKEGWCQAELSSNKATREEKTDQVDSLKSEIEELSSSIAKLGEEAVTLNEEVTQLTTAMANATEMRQKEKQKNLATVRDAKEAQEAVAQALQVLKEFYAKAGSATSLVQTSDEVPETFSEPYKGMGGESGGVLGMMEVIASDFARLQAETEAAEEAAKAEYEEFMEDSKVDKATKSKTAEHKASKKQSKSQELLASEGDLQGTQKELDAANAYLEKLKPDCVDTGASYAERKAQREEELKDLETALKMLENV